MPRERSRYFPTICCVWLGLALQLHAAVDSATARALWLRGRYEEAEELYAAMQTASPVDSVLGVARCEAE